MSKQKNDVCPSLHDVCPCLHDEATLIRLAWAHRSFVGFIMLLLKLEPAFHCG